MKAIDLKHSLGSYSQGWVAINRKSRKVIADAKTLAIVSEKVKGLKGVLLIPASKNYFGFITLLNA